MRNNTYKAMVALDASKDEVSIAIDASQVVAISAQIVMTGSATGTLNIQASNQLQPPVDANGNPAPTVWNDIATVGTVTLTAGGTFLIPKFDVAYAWLRASYVKNNASAGTVSVTINTKGF